MSTVTDVQTISCTAMFISEGLHDAGYEAVIAANASNGEGWVERVNEIADYARAINERAQKYVDLGFCYPGVFDYEVSVFFGKWYGGQLISTTKPPTDDEANEKIRELVHDFFLRGG